ncbi:MAG: isochorismatase family protein [Acidiferrobacter sp.]
MTATTLDRQTALIVVDLQKGIVRLPMAHPTAVVVAKAVELAASFRHHALPVVLVNVDGRAPGRIERGPLSTERPPDWTELATELGAHATDHRITKRSWGAFTETGLLEFLRARQVTQVVIAGIATSIGVETTARQAYELGFNVTLACDAMTDFSSESHDHSVQRLFPRLGETATVAEVVKLLAQRDM